MNILLFNNKIFIKQYALSVLYLLQCYITQVTEVTKPPPVGADPCVCPTPKGVTLRLNRWNMSFRHWADTWVRPYNREVTALPKLKYITFFKAFFSIVN